MYLSHPVRRMRRAPVAGATAELIVTAEEPSAADDLASRLSGLDLTVVDRHRFGAIRVRTTEARVEDICSLDGIESIETAGTRSLTAGDAGEDT